MIKPRYTGCQYVIGLLLAVACISPAFAATLSLADYQKKSAEALNTLRKDNESNPRNRAILTIVARKSVSDITRSVKTLKDRLRTHPKDEYAKAYYGYGQLFLSADFLRNKNYFRAAELAKQGFFYLDEATESQPNDWRLRFIRARMDAFIQPESGRCVVSLKDIAMLDPTTSKPSFKMSIPDTLAPMLAYLKAKSSAACGHSKEAEAISQRLKRSEMGRLLLAMSRDDIRFITVEEVAMVLPDVLEARP